METHGRFVFSEDQKQAVEEAHARPFVRIPAPSRVRHLAFRAEPEVLQAVADALAPDANGKDLRHAVSDWKGLTCKFERHTEFSSLTWIETAASGVGYRDNPPDFVKPEAIKALVLLEIDILDDADAFERTLPQADRVLTGVFAGALPARTTLQPRADGAIPFYLLARDADPAELGRRTQRVIELETYRIMCLLGLPAARRASDALWALEQRLEDTSAAIRSSDVDDIARNEEIFKELSNISAEVGALSAETRFRFAASRAYYDLVRQRLDALDETAIDGAQSITGFVLARLNPAIATIESTGARQETLGQDVLQALTLLRTRIELNLNRANQKLLQSMDTRHRQQVKISEAVESLSTVAITYYAVSLLAYILAAIAAASAGAISDTTAVAISVPVIFLSVVWAIRRMRRKWAKRAPASDND